MTKVYVLINGDNDIVGVYRCATDMFRGCVADMALTPEWRKRAMVWIGNHDGFTATRKAAVTNALRGESYSLSAVNPQTLSEPLSGMRSNKVLKSLNGKRDGGLR